MEGRGWANRSSKTNPSLDDDMSECNQRLVDCVIGGLAHCLTKLASHGTDKISVQHYSLEANQSQPHPSLTAPLVVDEDEIPELRGDS